MTLPADPDAMNDQRAEWARIAALSFARQTNQDYRTDGWEEILGDLLADIAHLCDREQISFRDVYVRGILAYQDETGVPMPFQVVDRAPVEDFEPGQTPPIVGSYPNARAAWEVLQNLPEAETGRFRIEEAP